MKKSRALDTWEATSKKETGMKAIRLKTEYMDNPIGIDVTKPMLSWNAISEESDADKKGDARQTAYEINAYIDDELVWSSGKVLSSKMHTLYGGKLKSKDCIKWMVRLWNDSDTVGDFSDSSTFEMGLLNREEFKALWINPEIDTKVDEHQNASYLEKDFEIKDNYKKARLYITSHGLYEAYINGERVGDNILTPGPGSYDKSLHYQTYDVTELIKEGGNTIRVILGDGWYRGCLGVDGDRNLYGEDVALWMQLEADGEIVCMSDGNFRASNKGALKQNDLQQGEIYDANDEEIDDWHEVKVENYDTDILCSSNMVPVTEHERFEGKIISTPNGETVIDYGQNLAGYIEFTINAHKGDKIILTHGESLDENGNFTQENFQDRDRHKEGGIRQQVVYICKEGVNHYKTRFSIWGFRYAKVDTSINIADGQFSAIAVYSDMEELSTFSCSEPLLEKLYENTMWSMKSNFCYVPTDCPTRERAAWTGDIGIFIKSGMYLMDCYTVVRNWLHECAMCQYPDGKVSNIAPKNNRPSMMTELLAGSVGWGDAVIIVPWEMYLRFSDERILEENLDMMKKWYEYLQSRAGSNKDAQGEIDINNIPDEYKAMVANMPKGALMEMMKKFAPKQESKDSKYDKYAITTGTDYGEWCEPDVDSVSNMGTPQSKVATAYFARSGRLLSKILRKLGDEEKASYYEEISKGATEAFRELALSDGRIDSTRQAEYVRAISFDLLNDKENKDALYDLNKLVCDNGYHLNTGFLSTPDLCEVLSQGGYNDTAYKLLLQKERPGWLYSVIKGATTIWESWNGIDEDGRVSESLNHYSKGAVCGWLISGICGINLSDNKLSITPRPDKQLQYAKAEYMSPLGKVTSGWEIENDGSIRYHFIIPANTEAEVTLDDGRKMVLKAGEYEL